MTEQKQPDDKNKISKPRQEPRGVKVKGGGPRSGVKRISKDKP